VKITPAHDPNDFELGNRHNLPQINTINPFKIDRIYLADVNSHTIRVVYGNGTVSFVAKCLAQLGRAYGELFEAMLRVVLRRTLS
jgi:hypothetical protein